jgi:hypothetical protein
MTVYFIDDLGEQAVYIDSSGIQFCDGKAYFGDGEREYIIPASDLVEII